MNHSITYAESVLPAPPVSIVTQVADWVSANFGVIALLLVVVVFILYKLYKNKQAEAEKAEKAEKADQEEEEEQPKFEPITDTDSLYFDRDFTDVQMMEEINIEQLQKFLDFTDDEIKKEIKTWNIAKKRYEDLIGIEERLRNHIPLLKRQKAAVEDQIARLKEAAK